MEYSTYLLALVFGYALFHLISQGIEHHRAWRLRTGKNTAGANRQIVGDDDWYVFFRPSRLTGSQSSSNQQPDRPSVKPSRRPPRRQRPVARMGM